MIPYHGEAAADLPLLSQQHSLVSVTSGDGGVLIDDVVKDFILSNIPVVRNVSFIFLNNHLDATPFRMIVTSHVPILDSRRRPLDT